MSDQSDQPHDLHKNKNVTSITKSLVIGGVGFLVIAGIIILSALASNGNSGNVSDNSSTGATQTSSQSQTPAQTTGEKISAWSQKYGSDISTIGDDFGTFGTDAQNLDYAAVLSDCQKLQSDSSTALNLPAIPDANAAAHFSSGLTYSQQTAQQCTNAMHDHYAGNDNQAVSELESANADESSATAQFNETTKIINQDSQ